MPLLVEGSAPRPEIDSAAAAAGMQDAIMGGRQGEALEVAVKGHLWVSTLLARGHLRLRGSPLVAWMGRGAQLQHAGTKRILDMASLPPPPPKTQRLLF